MMLCSFTGELGLGMLWLQLTLKKETKTSEKKEDEHTRCIPQPFSASGIREDALLSRIEFKQLIIIHF